MENILGQLNPNKSTGVDKISARFERIAAPSSSIAKLIYYCICYGTFPDHWKVAKVTSLFNLKVAKPMTLQVFDQYRYSQACLKLSKNMFMMLFMLTSLNTT